MNDAKQQGIIRKWFGEKGFGLQAKSGKPISGS
jgi:hypothetical protein